MPEVFSTWALDIWMQEWTGLYLEAVSDSAAEEPQIEDEGVSLVWFG